MSTEFNLNIYNNEIKKYKCELRVISIKTIKIIFDLLIDKLDKGKTNYEQEKTKLENKRDIYINKYHQLIKK